MENISSEREQYFEEKSRFAYNLYKQGKFFRKARAIIKDGDSFLVLHVPEKDIYGISGGGINDGETATNGCKREVLEEMGIKVKPEKLLFKHYYRGSMEYNGTKFYPKCVEFYYLCKPIKVVKQEHLGISGEFIADVEIAKLTKEEFLTKIKFKYGVAEKLREALQNI